MNNSILPLLILAVLIFVFSRWVFQTKSRRRHEYFGDDYLTSSAWRLARDRSLLDTKRTRRRDYYRDEYLKSDAWKRKRYVVLKRDNWRCVYCGARATQVHHMKYAKNIGKEPIEWLVSICKPCHDAKHL